MTATPVDHSQSVSMLRLTAEHLKKITFPQLVREHSVRDQGVGRWSCRFARP